MKKNTYKIIIKGDENRVSTSVEGYCEPYLLMTGMTQALIGIAKRFEISEKDLRDAIKMHYNDKEVGEE